MQITIRTEQPDDYAITESVVQHAFANMEHSDKKEHELVSRIRASKGFVPALSLVAIDEDRNAIVGHILLSDIQIRTGDDCVPVLALAPVSVLPAYQNQGIGTLLIREALQKAKELGYLAVIVLGHPAYYPKFGFKPASAWAIRPPFEVPDEVFMALELQEHALDQRVGVVQYPGVFFA